MNVVAPGRPIAMGRETIPQRVAASSTRRRVPAYDGVRAVLIVAVFLFHAQFKWAKGGFLSVSVFFTLSGFLITGLVVNEYKSTGRMALGQFWDRRFRRLLPGAAATIGLCVLLAPHLLGYSYKTMRADALGAIFDVANWRQLFAKESYAQLLNPGTTSPLLHFWSLAVEEQFYLVFPLVAAVSLRFGGIRGLKWAIIGLIGGSLVVISQCHSFNAVYYNTGSRAAEILAGSLLAVVVGERPSGFLAGGGITPETARHIALRTVLGLAGFAFLVWGMTHVTTDDAIVQQGFLPAFSVASCFLVVACTGPGPIRRVLGVRPLPWLGERSYGLYLIHWPIFLVLQHNEPTWHPVAVLAVGTSSAVAVAAVSYKFLEQPIRSWRPSGAGIRRAGKGILVPALATSLIVTLAVAHPLAPQPTVTPESALITDFNANGPAGPVAPPTPNSKFTTITVFGDSTAGYLGEGLGTWATETGDARVVGASIAVGCPLARGGKMKWPTAPQTVPPGCDWSKNWAADIPQFPAKVALVEFGLMDANDRTIPGDNKTYHHFGEPVYDNYVRSEIEAAAEFLSSRGFKVVWLLPPPADVSKLVTGRPPKGGYPASDPARMARFDQIISEVDQELPGMASVDLPTYLASLPGGALNPALRSDGVHFRADAAAQVSRDFLGPAILDAAASLPDPP